MVERLLYRVPEAAEAMGVSRARGYELVADGTIPSIKIGKSRRVPVDGLRRVIAERVAAQLAEQRADADRGDNLR